MTRRLDLHRLDRELEALADQGLSSHAFRHEAMARLRHVVPADAWCCSSADPDTLVMTGHAGGGVDPELAPVVYANEYGVADVAKHAELARGRRPVRLLAHETRGEVERSARFRDLLAPMGMVHELRAATIERGATWGFVHLYRGRGRPEFHADEVEAVGRVGRRLAAGIRAAALAPGAAPRTDDAPGVLLLDADDRLLVHSGIAADWLAAREDPDFGRGPVPELLCELAAVARASAAGGASGTVIPRVRTRDRDGRWWALHAATVGDPEEADDRVTVTVAPAPAPALASLLLRGLGLTDGEREVCRLVLDGCSTKEIAGLLSISPWTVQDRLKGVFDKAQVRSRRELVARLNPAAAAA
jgi:DNA-binding CsgD family transcriptional regulator/GAF domain-containing protein